MRLCMDRFGAMALVCGLSCAFTSPIPARFACPPHFELMQTRSAVEFRSATDLYSGPPYVIAPSRSCA